MLIYHYVLLSLAETFRESESGGELRSSAAAVDVDGSDSKLVPVTGSDVADLCRRQRRLHIRTHTHTHIHTRTPHDTSINCLLPSVRRHDSRARVQYEDTKNN